MTAKLNHRETVYQGRAFRVLKDNVTLENGRTVNMDVVRHPGAAAIVAVAQNGSVFLLKQYRYAVGGFIWEIPAGTLDAGEAPLDCAKRELIEETGFGAESWQKLGALTPAPGYTDEIIHIYLAENIVSARQNLDPDEILDVHQVPFEVALDMIRKGEIADGKTVAGIFLANEARGKAEGD